VPPWLSKNTKTPWAQLRTGRHPVTMVNVLSTDIRSSKDERETVVRGLLDKLASAELLGDAAFLERSIADGFVAIGPRGFMLSKSEWLARHTSGDLRYTSFMIEQVAVHWAGPDTAVATGKEKSSADYKGNAVPESEMRFMQVIVRGGGSLGEQGGETWRLAAKQLSPILAPPPGIGAGRPGQPGQGAAAVR
jgi:Domain of unknown function (DUF4440)